MVKGITHVHLGPIWYHSEPSDVLYSPNQFLGWDFFAVSYSKTTLNSMHSLVVSFKLWKHEFVIWTTRNFEVVALQQDFFNQNYWTSNKTPDSRCFLKIKFFLQPAKLENFKITYLFHLKCKCGKVDILIGQLASSQNVTWPCCKPGRRRYYQTFWTSVISAIL